MSNPLILLVEDNPDDEELTRLAFAKAGVDHSLAVARDGGEALDFLFGGEAAGRAPSRPPHLILLDLKLPKMDGLEVLRRLRLRPEARLIPVVILSTSLEQSDIAASYSLGANSYVRKPVDFDRFAEVMRQVCSYWLSINEYPDRRSEPRL